MTWQPNIGNPFRGIIVWPEPEPVDITVTLYKVRHFCFKFFLLMFLNYNLDV